MHAARDVSGGPNIPNCVGAILKLHKQFGEDSIVAAAQKLRAFLGRLLRFMPRESLLLHTSRLLTDLF